MSLQIELKQAMSSYGLMCQEPIVADSRFHRFKMNGDKGKPCWYIAHDLGNGLAYASYGCFKRIITASWCNRGDISQLSDYDKNLIKQRQEKDSTEQAIKQDKEKKATWYIWENAQPDFLDHPYLKQKQVKSLGLRLYKNKLLIVPLYNQEAELCSLQFITIDGCKWFKKDISIKGSFFIVGSIGETIYIAEGYATAATIHMAIGCGVVVAFNANNLLAVAKVIKNKYRDKKIVICADNDAYSVDGKNVGVEAVENAAKIIGAKIAIPTFKNTFSKPTDFNDLMILEGIEEVRKQLDNPLNKPMLPEYKNETLEEAIERLAKLTPLQCDQVREEEAKNHNVRLATLDKEVEKKRCVDGNDNGAKREGVDNELEEGVEPWGCEVEGNVIADEIQELIRNHAVLTEHQITAIVLFMFGTYCFDVFDILPKLLITSPEKRCGKTTVLSILRSVIHRVLICSNITPSAIFRSIDLWKPTLVIDEGDTFINNDNEDLRGTINSGHTRDTAFAVRNEKIGDTFMPTKFSTWAPMVIAMIKNPPDTILDRSIIIKLKRKLSSERISKWSYKNFEKLKPLRQKIKRWANDNFEVIENREPNVPIIDNDRAMDNWLPLFAVASILGGEWLVKTEASFKDLNIADSNNDENISTMLLIDIKDVFEGAKIDKIHSSELVKKLIELEDRLWGEYRHGKPITSNTLAKLLKPFGIKSKQIWSNGINKYGYQLIDFENTFSRYISSYTPPVQNTRTLDPNTGAGFNDFQNARDNYSLAFQNASKPLLDAESSVLAFQNGGIEGSIYKNEETGVITI